MLSNLARLLLVATSMTPVALVYGFTRIPQSKVEALVCFVGSSVLVLLCRWVLGYVRRHVPPENLQATEVEVRDSEVLAFLIAYALPLVTQEEETTLSWGLGALLVLMMIVLARCNLFHVNPLLGLLGFHFFNVKSTAGLAYLVITRNESLRPGTLRVALITPVLVVEAPEEVGHG